jgi:hypothetical protein
MSKLPNTGTRAPLEYIEMMRHYLPDVPLALIKEAWLHNATPKEVMGYLSALQRGPI